MNFLAYLQKVKLFNGVNMQNELREITKDYIKQINNVFNKYGISGAYSLSAGREISDFYKAEVILPLFISELGGKPIDAYIYKMLFGADIWHIIENEFNFTKTELKILHLINEDVKTKVLADIMKYPQKTIRKYFERIIEKIEDSEYKNYYINKETGLIKGGHAGIKIFLDTISTAKENIFQEYCMWAEYPKNKVFSYKTNYYEDEKCF